MTASPLVTKINTESVEVFADKEKISKNLNDLADFLQTILRLCSLTISIEKPSL